MLITIAVVQMTIFALFFLLERVFPGKRYEKTPLWCYWWVVLGLFALIWMRLMIYLWIDIDFPGLLFINHSAVIIQGIIFYLFYSLGNYWFHRVKHSNSKLWRYLHRLHHSPAHMETRLAFFRHPLEIIANSIYLFILGKVVLGVEIEVVAIALLIEGSLEVFHHSNIRLPRIFRKMGYIIQTPDMHLVHHQYLLHRYNYGPFLWDWVFGTLCIPDEWDNSLGFSNSKDVLSFLMCKTQ